MGINLFCHQIRDPKGIVKPPPYSPNTHPLITSQSAALVLSLPSSWLRNRFRAKELWKFNLSNTYVHILDIASSRTIFDQRWRVTNLRDRQRRYRKVKGNGRPNAKPITIYLRPPPIHRIDKACEAIGACTETNRVSNTLLLTPVSLPPSLSLAPTIYDVEQRRRSCCLHYDAHLRRLESILYRSFFTNPVGGWLAGFVLSVALYVMYAL